MQTLQITGTTTYADNIKNLKIGDNVKLIKNPTNKINADAIGVYTIDGLKIGYTPFKESQINIKSKYTVSKINLINHPPLVLLSYNFESSNFIKIEPEYILELHNINKSYIGQTKAKQKLFGSNTNETNDKNNICLFGSHGCGKTELIYNVARSLKKSITTIS